MSAKIKGSLFLFLAFFAWAPSARSDFSGRLQFLEQDFYQPQIEPVRSLQDNLTLEIQEKMPLGESWRFLLEPKVQASTTSRISSMPYDLNLRDTLLEGKFDRTYVQLGSFVKVWEGPDGYNPMDIASMKDYRDPLSPDSLGSVGAALKGGGEIFTWDFFYVPWQTRSRLPGENSRWLPRRLSLPTQADGEVLLAPAEPRYQIDEGGQIDGALKNNFGARFGLRGAAWDMAVAGFEGAAQIPAFHVVLDGDLKSALPGAPPTVQFRNPLVVQPIDYRRRSFSALLVSSAVETWIFRLAGRYDRPLGADQALPDRSYQLVGGAEKTLMIAGQPVVISLQYAFGRSLQTQAGVLALSDPFANAVVYGFRWPIGESLVLSYSGIWSHEVGASYNKVEASKKIAEHWEVQGSFDRLRGRYDNPFGIWADQDRVSVGANFLF
jgi:hypothetical protein